MTRWLRLGALRSCARGHSWLILGLIVDFPFRPGHWISTLPRNFPLFVWGHSHAMAVIADAVVACHKRPVSLFQATQRDTPPLVGIDSRPLHRGQARPDFGEAVLRLFRRERVDR